MNGFRSHHAEFGSAATKRTTVLRAIIGWHKRCTPLDRRIDGLFSGSSYQTWRSHDAEAYTYDDFGYCRTFNGFGGRMLQLPQNRNGNSSPGRAVGTAGSEHDDQHYYQYYDAIR
jgi:hypothetical protein